MKQTLDFTTETVPTPQEVITVADGIRWLRLPLPFALNHVNIWLMDDSDDALTVVDTGIATDLAKNIWIEHFKNGALKDQSIDRVLVTHFHPDHMGLAGWLCERFKAPLWAPRADWMKARILCRDDSDRFNATGVAFYRALGIPQDYLLHISQRGNMYAKAVSPVPCSYNRLRDGLELTIGDTVWQVIITPGHAPDMACLYSLERNILISADHILPEISPNVSVWADEPNGNPLKDFRQSLAKVKERVPADCLVLPSHGRPFCGLHERIDWLDQHHEERLAETLEACAKPATGKMVMDHLFTRELDSQQWGFAMGESLAHLNYLIETGQIVRDTGDDGIWHFHSA